jgi:polar amino acid transport system substrate-binding protein
MPHRKIITLFYSLLIFMAALVTSPVVMSETSTLASIKQSGQLILGTSANMPPMTGTNENGKNIGFDIHLARLMADSMGVKLNIKTIPFDELLSSLENGDIDVIISNMTMNPQRNMSVAFVGPYMTSGKCVLAKKEGLAKAQATENLNSPNVRLTALKGSTSVEFIKSLLPEATITLVDEYDDAIRLINEDKAGGLLTDYPICLSMLKRYPDSGFVSLFSLLSYEPIGIALPAGDSHYINWTENFLKRLEGIGALNEIKVHWFGKTNLTSTNN